MINKPISCYHCSIRIIGKPELSDLPEISEILSEFSEFWIMVKNKDRSTLVEGISMWSPLNSIKYLPSNNDIRVCTHLLSVFYMIGLLMILQQNKQK